MRRSDSSPCAKARTCGGPSTDFTWAGRGCRCASTLFTCGWSSRVTPDRSTIAVSTAPGFPVCAPVTAMPRRKWMATCIATNVPTRRSPAAPHLRSLAGRAFHPHHLRRAAGRNPPCQPLSQIAAHPAGAPRRHAGQQPATRRTHCAAACRCRSRRSGRCFSTGSCAGGHGRRAGYGRSPCGTAAARSLRSYPHPQYGGVLPGSAESKVVPARARAAASPRRSPAARTRARNACAPAPPSPRSRFPIEPPHPSSGSPCGVRLRF